MRPPDVARRAGEMAALGPWFHNLHLPDGLQTAPDHPLGDFPARPWACISQYIPADLRGWSALDVGCNAGFYSFELARRGARVTAIDSDPRYLAQASWAARELGLEGAVTLRQMSVYELARHPERYDLVWFMGVFYHLRYPLLGLDIVAEKVERLMIFQTLSLPGHEVEPAPDDIALDMEAREPLHARGWPKLAFIEQRLAGDLTNWWVPNHAAVEAMLRSNGLAVQQLPCTETYLCRPDPARPSCVATWNRQEFLAATGQ